MPSWMSVNFQDFSSSSIFFLIDLHNYVMVIILIVLFLITYILVFIFSGAFYYKFLSEGTLIETIWSLVPALLLLMLVVPSMKVLYWIEDVRGSPFYTFKVVAHQWYWTYLIPIIEGVCYSFSSNKFFLCEYDSMLVADPDSPRLLSCEESLLMPVKVSRRLLISSTDVIHSFAIPSLGLKVDAVPGRINQLLSTPKRVGKFFGQCSEICGSNHSFMPIRLAVIPFSTYVDSTGLLRLEQILV